METTLTEEKKDSRGYRIGFRASGLRGTGFSRKALDPINWDTPFCNRAERGFTEQARKAGWKVTKRGWPDFICYREVEGETRVVFVEVKPTRKYRTRAAQERLFSFLGAIGIEVVIWSPDAPVEI